jgi:hypothetical protein
MSDYFEPPPLPSVFHAGNNEGSADPLRSRENLGEDSSWKPALQSQVDITVESGGFFDGCFARICINGESVMECERGMNCVVLDPLSGKLRERDSFDVHISKEESEELTRFIEFIEEGMIVVVAAKDDASENFSESARVACESIGSSMVRSLGYRDSWCIIGKKGVDKGTVPEMHRASRTGPAGPLRQSVDLRGVPAGEAFMGPSHGRWYRRRLLDGSLCRASNDFYPRVWRILDASKGIEFRGNFLPRDPTVSEMTPKEFNFALSVISLLDSSPDPADRQVAVECLMVLSKLQERNPEMLLAHIIKLDAIITEASKACWHRWTSSDAEAVPPPSLQALMNSKKSMSYDANEAFALKFFSDLPQEGKDGTVAYIAPAIFSVIPFSINAPHECATQ